MEWLKGFLKEPTGELQLALWTLLTGFIGYLGLRMKSIAQMWQCERMKKSTARMCVRAVEQLYPNLHGRDKYDKASASILEILSEKGVKLSEIELEMLIESCVREMNNEGDLFWREIEQLKRIANGLEDDE